MTKEEQLSLSWEDRIERVEVKKELSLVRSSFWIFTGVKEQSNTGLWMVTATPNFSIRWQIEGESLIYSQN